MPEDLDELKEIFDEQNPQPPPQYQWKSEDPRAWGPPKPKPYVPPREPYWWEDAHRVAAACTTAIILTLVMCGCILLVGWTAYIVGRLNGG